MSTTDEATTARCLVEVEYSVPAPQRQRIEVTTTAEASASPGLAIVPCLRGDWLSPGQFTGTWEVRHVATGCTVIPCCGLGLGNARDAAALLGDLGVDWTQPREAVIEACRSLPLHELFVQVNQAVKGAYPVRMCSSWHQVERGWFVYDTTADDVVAGLFDDAADAEEAFRHLISIGQSAGCVIRREDREPWSLRCAWVDCPELLGADERLSHPDPAGVVEFAHGDGWRQVTGQHWLCPTCSHLFANIHHL